MALGLCLLLLPGSGLALETPERSLDETAIRLELGEERSWLILPVVNAGPTTGARFRVETLTPEGDVGLSLERDLTLEAGERSLRVELPARLGRPRGTPQNELLLDRLRFELKTDDGWVASGVRGLSAIVGLFELRVIAPYTARSGSRVTVHVLARRVATGEPLEGVAVETRLAETDEGDVGRGRTDARGRATVSLRLPSDLEDAEHEIRVQGQLGGIGAEAVSELWTSSNLRALVTTDKPLYQPGQPLRVRLLAFHPRERVAAGLPVSFSLRAPDGEAVLERTLTTSGNGVASLEWSIPERAALGDYHLEVHGEGGRNLGPGRTVRVSRYELPVLRLDARSERPFYLPRQRRARVVVRVETLTGEPVEGARVTVRGGVAESDEDQAEDETDARGRAVLSVDLADAHRQLRDEDWRQFADLGYEAHVVDPISGRSEARRFDIRITRHPVHVYWQESSGGLPVGFGVDGFVATYSADGTPLACDVRFSGTFKVRVRTNERGQARVRTERPPGEDAPRELRVEARDDQGRKGRLEDHVYVNTDPVVRLRAAATLLRPGDPVRIRVQADPPGEVLLHLQRGDQPVAAREVMADAEGVFVDFAYQEGWADELCVGAIRSDGERWQGIDSLCVFYPRARAPELKVEAQPARARPGERVRARLQLRDRRGAPRAGVVGLVGVDQALLDRARSQEEFGDFWYSHGLFEDDPIGALDLDALDAQQPWEPSLELAAAWGLRDGDFYLNRATSEGPDLQRAYQPVVLVAMAPIQEALDDRHWPDPGYPVRVEALLDELATHGFEARGLLDPWGRRYRFRLAPGREHMQLEAVSAGPDELFHSPDDLTVTVRSWPLYARLAKKLRRALERYVDTHGTLPRNVRGLRDVLRREGVDPGSLEDAHGERLRLELRREGRHGVLACASDLALFEVKLDLYADAERRVREALAAFSAEAGGLPQDEATFWKALSDAGIETRSICDPWGHAPWPVFRLESRHGDLLGLRVAETGAATRERISAVSQDVEAIELRSAGPDGKRGSRGDVHLADFSRLARELSPTRTRPRRGAVVSETTGAILGQVTDHEGGVLPGATVAVEDIDGDHEAVTVTDGDGEYVVGALPPGNYRVVVSLPGFKNLETHVRVLAGRATVVDAELEVGEVTESISVTASERPTGTTSAEVAPREEIRLSLRPPATPRLREYFPETLLWEPEVEIGPSGEAEVAFTLADSLTTWKLNALASTDDGFVTTAETEVVGFLPFFGELDPPPVLTAGDRLELPLVVRNQLETEERAEVSLEASAGLAIGPASATRLDVPAGGTAVATFPVRAEAPAAEVALTATVLGGDSGDRVRKRLRVRPDGEDVEGVQADLLSGDAELSFTVPPEALPGTAWGELRILPGLRAQIVDAIEGSLHRPYGCAEQTVSAGFPSLLFLELAGEEAQGPQVERARLYLRRAVERLEAFQAAGGGFGYWWASEADTAVTAHGLRLLVRARGLVEGPERLVASALKLLLKRQGPDGRWGGSWALTAFVARALAQLPSPGERPDGALLRSLEALRGEVGETQEPYVLATAALVGLELDDGELVGAALERLRGLEHREGEGSFWHPQTNTPFFGWGRAGRLETTGLVAQALVGSGQPGDEARRDRALLFLLRHQDAYGVWWSSQATVNVLEALAARARQEPAVTSPRGPVQVRLDGADVGSVDWDEGDDPARTVPLGSPAAGTHRLELRGLPPGSSIVRLVTGHARPWPETASGISASGTLRLAVDYDRTDLQRLGSVTARLEARRVGFRGYGMMLAEVGLPPGSDVDRFSLEDQLWRSGLCRYEVRPDRVVLYLWPFGGQAKVDVRFRPRLALDAKSAPSQLYDYYNPDERVRLPPKRFTVRP